MKHAPQLIVLVVVVFAAVGVAVLLRDRGAFRGDAFADAPVRAGNLSLADLFMGLGLWLLGQIVGAGVGLAIIGDLATATAAEKRLLLACHFGGAMIGVVAILVRARFAMADGLRGFGLSLDIAPRAITPAVLGFMAITPLVLALSQIVVALLSVLDVQPPQIAHDILVLIVDGSIEQRISLIALAVVVAPFVEEIVFRGLIQTALRTSGIIRNPWWAILLATIPFTAIHVSGSENAIALPAIYVLSIGLGWLYERYGNLWVCILVHGMFNASQVAIALLFYAE